MNYQPYFDTLEELFTFHKEKKLIFDKKVSDLAANTNGTALIPGLKGYRLTDIVRATILYDSIPDMYHGLQAIDKDDSLRIIEFNDRYQEHLDSGYRDLQLAVSINDMVCELQLNTHVMAFVKEHSGHRGFEVKRELVAAIAQSDAGRCSEILFLGRHSVVADGPDHLKDILDDDRQPVLHQVRQIGSGLAGYTIQLD
ncbi:Pclo [Symbiodinium pilosum]|uniref:Pclo protein n=1 Tax=Symbiodinium pilosum TaxID=2952 RepID=A0A812RVL0_SYMPI|nr:Pclo [Symbiodinium pilosum]